MDGDNRTALVVSETFLTLDGYALDCDDVAVVVTFLLLAAGEMTVEQLVA